MKIEIKDGGLAFPCAGAEGVNPESLGMTLRDYFAGQAINGMMIHLLDYKKDGAMSNEDMDKLISKACYEIADAMIKAREIK